MRVRALLSGCALTAVISVGAFAAPAARADSVGISFGESAEQGISLDVSFSGAAGASDLLGDGDFLYAVDRPADRTPCGATFGDDQGAEPDSDIIEVGDGLDANAPFTVTDQITPDIGPSIVCAWVETSGDDGNPGDVSAGQVTASMSAGFSAVGPQVGPIKVSVPSRITAAQAFTIRYATSSDQDLSLDSVVVAATGSSTCASSYEDQLSRTNPGNDVFGGSADADGQTSNSASDTETNPGNYLICSWVEGPDDTQVDATQTTKITVVAPGTNSPGGSGTGAGAPNSGTRRGGTKGTPVTSGGASGSSGAGHGAGRGSRTCTVPLASGVSLAAAKRHLLAGGCRVGSIHYVRTHRVRAGRVLKLAVNPGRQLRYGSPVAITVARG